MRLPTYQELEARVRRDLDLQDEDNFVSNDEMASYANEAINDAEAEIMSLHEDYFLTKSAISFVTGVKEIALPANIYAQKIREFIYNNNAVIYEIQRVRDPHKFYRIAQQDFAPSGVMDYRYMLQSDNAGAQDTIQLSPPAQETGAVAELWYIRNANRVPLTTESGITRAIQLAKIIDIPEWGDYIVQFMKCRCLAKDLNPRAESELVALANRKKMLVETLANRTPDNEDAVPMDLSAYYDHN